MFGPSEWKDSVITYCAETEAIVVPPRTPRRVEVLDEYRWRQDARVVSNTMIDPYGAQSRLLNWGRIFVRDNYDSS